MTRINTNVSSLIAQKTLARSNGDLQTALTRLSTGLRINVGKDDPAGLIASEALRSDIISVEKGITNSERANQLIATADSALGQVSQLLNDIRGLVSEAANTGALSEDQISANQLQLDSSLEAIDRIAQITSFQGRRLLDGNLDFITSGVDTSAIQGLRIDQANFGTQSSIGVAVNVVTQATKGALNYKFGAISNNVVLEIGGANGTEAFNFAAGSTISEVASAVNLVSDATGVQAKLQQEATKGAATISSFGTNNDINLTANEAGFDAGNVRIKYTKGGTANTQVTFTAGTGGNPATIDVQLQTRAAVAAKGTVDDTGAANNALDITAKLKGADFNGVNVNVVNSALSGFTAITAGNETFEYSADAKAAHAILNFADANTDLVVTANNAGSDYNEVAIVIADAGVGNATEAAYDANAKTITLKFDFADTTVAVADVKTVINGIVDGDGAKLFTATDGNGSTGAGNINGTTAGNQTATGNTGFTGGDANTLYINVESGTSTAANIATSLTTRTDQASLRAAQLFTIGNANDSDGSGVLVAASYGDVTSGGVTGGDVIATANDVVSKINSAQTKVAATLATGNNGYSVVTEFQQFAKSGSAQNNNSLQFLAPTNAPKIKFVAGAAGSGLSIDTTTDPRTLGLSSFTVQNEDANGSFTLRAKFTGTEYDGYTVSVVDNASVTAGTNEFAVLDKTNKTLTINIDNGNSTAQNVVDAINSDSFVSQFFEAENYGDSTGADAVTIADLNLTSASKTTGGLASEGTLIVNLATDANGIVTTTANDLTSFFNDPSQFISNGPQAAATLATLQTLGISVTNSEGSNGTGKLSATTSDITFATSGTELEDAQASGTTNAVNGDEAQLTFTAVTPGSAFNDVTISFVNDNTVTQGNERGEYDANAKTLTFYIAEGATTAADIEDIFTSSESNYDADLAATFSVALQTGATGTGLISTSDAGSLSGGQVDNGTTDGAALLGNSDLANVGITFESTKFGSDSFVQVKALSGTFSLTNGAGAAADREHGTDVNVRINGIQAIGKGLNASINTSSLDLSFSIGEAVDDNTQYDFSITGGGALFQLGPDVVSNQQARLGIQSVSTATLGGVSGRLFELRSGGAKALNSDVGGAANVVEEVISVVTSLRGRLGAFQRTTLESNIFTLNDTLANLTDAESSIRDADFAAESAKLTRAQILVQSGTSVLSIANSNPQNVLSLLRG